MEWVLCVCVFRDIHIENFIDPPRPNLKDGVTILKYMEFVDDSSILAPMLITSQNKIIYEIFYCSKCEKWLKISTTITNVYNHINKKHCKKVVSIPNPNESSLPNRDEMENNIKNIDYRLKAFVILNGYPFSDIEDEDLNSICNLSSRASLVRTVETLALQTKQKIRCILESASIISIAVDEWQDRMKRRYLGVTAAAIVERQIRIFTLAHRPMREQHCTAEVIRKYLYEILNEYRIARKIKCAVTDNGGSVPSAFCDDPTDVHNLNIKRFPCICHIINIYAKTFQKHMKSDLNDFMKIRNAFDTACFVAYLENSDSNIKKIASYTEIRWSSLYNMLHDLMELKKYIMRYNKLNKIVNEIGEEFWERLSQWFKIFGTFAKCIKLVEGNEFGLISKSLPCIRRIQQALLSLPERYSGVILEINRKMESHWNKYKDNWTPILHVCARLNPFIKHAKILTKAEIELADETIKLLLKGKIASCSNVPEKIINKSNDDFNFMVDDEEYSSEDIFGEYLNSLTQMKKEGDLLKYWLSKIDSTWKQLAELAFDFLSIPSSSATAERQFSITGRSLGVCRLKTSEEHVEDSAILLLNPTIARPLLESLVKNH